MDGTREADPSVWAALTHFTSAFAGQLTWHSSSVPLRPQGSSSGGSVEALVDAALNATSAMHRTLSESKCALVYGQMNEPLGGCVRVDLTGLTVAEHFADAKGQGALLFIGIIFHFTEANSEVSAFFNSDHIVSDGLPRSP